ncbi:Deoxyhypusine hydroxylase [Trinorchestia longiramus]|nr:Deoxyhypusine hydroxylase [Trinorchestia longiramus]
MASQSFSPVSQGRLKLIYFQMVSECEIAAIGALLQDSQRPLKERFRALFTLRNLGGDAAISAIAGAFGDESALLKHELAYCLGQMKDSKAIPVLLKVLEDRSQEAMVRHEAGEALGAIGDATVMPILEKYTKDDVVEVAETCHLALERLKYVIDSKNNSSSFEGATQFNSIDPTPPSACTDLEELKNTLLDEKASLYDRYRAMFSLRNMNTKESAKVLAMGFKCGSALFRHEIGFVLGQLECGDVVEELAAVVRDTTESGMVRHEAAEALGAIATDEAVQVLKEHLTDPVDVVRESCEVALDMSDYNNSAEFQYANSLQLVQ